MKQFFTLLFLVVAFLAATPSAASAQSQDEIDAVIEMLEDWEFEWESDVDDVLPPGINGDDWLPDDYWGEDGSPNVPGTNPNLPVLVTCNSVLTSYWSQIYFMSTYYPNGGGSIEELECVAYDDAMEVLQNYSGLDDDVNNPSQWDDTLSTNSVLSVVFDRPVGVGSVQVRILRDTKVVRQYHQASNMPENFNASSLWNLYAYLGPRDQDDID